MESNSPRPLPLRRTFRSDVKDAIGSLPRAMVDLRFFRSGSRFQLRLQVGQCPRPELLHPLGVSFVP